MATIKLTLSEDVLKLVSNIRFREFPEIAKDDQTELKTEEQQAHIGYEIDLYSLYGGNFLLEDIAYILNANLSTVKSLLYRSLKKLKLEMVEGEL